jgi:hypothetical protein
VRRAAVTIRPTRDIERTASITTTPDDRPAANPGHSASTETLRATTTFDEVLRRTGIV